MSKGTDNRNNNSAAAFRALSVKDFTAFGTGHLAYITPSKPAFAGAPARPGYQLRHADGNLLAVKDTPAELLALARQNGLDVLPVQ